MATFSIEEYGDIERLRKGYEGILRCYVPYALDPRFGALDGLIAFHDKITGVEKRPKPYRIIDGIEIIDENHQVQSYNPTQHLELIANRSFEQLGTLSFLELAQKIIADADQHPQGRSVFFLKHQDSDEIKCAIGYSKGKLSVKSFHKGFGQELWESAEIQCRIDQDARLIIDTQSDEFSVFLKALSSVSNTKVESLGDNLENLEILSADIGIETQLQNDFTKGIAQKTLASSKGSHLCLMNTQEWVLAALDYRNNVLGTDKIRELAGPDRYEEGNCVEISTAIGLNFTGGVRGRFVGPRMRLMPTEDALKASSIKHLLMKSDPLHNQSIPSRVFENKNDDFAYGAPLSNIRDMVDESGAVVSVFGHTFFAVKHEGEIDIYDLSLGYVGDLGAYEKFLYNAGSAPILRSVVQVQQYSQEATDFYRKCREPFMDPEVIDLAEKTFLSFDAEKKTAVGLYDAWKHSLCMYPEKIAASFGGQHKPAKEIAQFDLDNRVVADILREQESGFMIFERSFGEDTNKIKFAVMFEGERAFSVSGRFSSAITKESALEQIANSKDYVITHLGGNSLHRSIENFHSKSVSRQNVANPDPGLSF